MFSHKLCIFQLSTFSDNLNPCIPKTLRLPSLLSFIVACNHEQKCEKRKSFLLQRCQSFQGWLCSFTAEVNWTLYHSCQQFASSFNIMACHLAVLVQYSLQVSNTATAFSYSFTVSVKTAPDSIPGGQILKIFLRACSQTS